MKKTEFCGNMWFTKFCEYNKELDICCEDANGKAWIVFTITEDGKYYRRSLVGEATELSLNAAQRIKKDKVMETQECS